MDGYYGLSLENIQRFVLGGKADFIIKEIDNNTHINYQVRKDVKNKDIFYVKYKSINWIYLGYINITEVPLFFKSNKINNEEDILKAEIFRKLILYIYHINRIPSNIEVLYTGVCSVCGRMLTDPKYIEVGIGKICLTKE